MREESLLETTVGFVALLGIWAFAYVFLVLLAEYLGGM